MVVTVDDGHFLVHNQFPVLHVPDGRDHDDVSFRDFACRSQRELRHDVLLES